MCLRPETWDEVAPSATEEERTAALEQLGQYLVRAAAALSPSPKPCRAGDRLSTP